MSGSYGTPDGEGVVIPVRDQMNISVTLPDPALDIPVAQVSLDPDLNPTLPTTFYQDIQTRPVVGNSGWTNTFPVADSDVSQKGGLSFDQDGSIVVNQDGHVYIGGYFDCSHSANNAVVGLTFQITRGGFSFLSPRILHATMPNTGQIGEISGGGDTYLQAGDKIKLMMASNKAGTVSVLSANLRVILRY